MARPRPKRPARPAIALSESEGLRHLHVGGTAIQSAMRIEAPDDLALAYTRAMMACLIFVPAPRDVLMVGLGGGSLAKFVYRRVARARIVAVELDLRVVEAAHRHFGLPIGRRRLRVIVGDGAEVTGRTHAGADLLLLDAFHNHRQAPSIRTAAFYRSAREALRPGGVLVVNFMLDDPGLHAYVARLSAAFSGHLVALRAWGEDNVIVLAFRDDPGPIEPAALYRRARPLERRFGLELADFALRMRPAHRLRVRARALAPSPKRPAGRA